MLGMETYTWARCCVCDLSKVNLVMPVGVAEAIFVSIRLAIWMVP